MKTLFKQTFGRLLDIIAIKEDFILSVLWVENLQICNLRTGSPKKFMDLRCADKSKEICGFEIC
jgi:hypothetical protein